MATEAEEDAAKIRDDLENKLAEALIIALASRPEDSTGASNAVRQSIEAAFFLALIAAMSALLAMLVRNRSIEDQVAGKMMRDLKTQTRMDDLVRESAQELADTATVWAGDHNQRLIETERPVQPVDRTWAKSAARSLATQATSRAMENAVELVAPAVQEVIEEKRQKAAEEDGAPIIELPVEMPADQWRKVWISQSDKKVRSLHRRLHGQPADIDKAFWKWPLTGQQLRYPGDPLAPIDQIVNCRCVLFYVPAEISPDQIVETFAPSDFDTSFDIVASAGTPAEQRALEDFIYERGSQ